MPKSMKKLVFLENVDQAKIYLKIKKKLKDFTPISFNFNVENFLLQQNIAFAKEEDYESENFYNGIYKSSKESLDKIFKNIHLKYKEVELLSLFYYDLCVFLSQSKKDLRLIKKIIKKEQPSEILVFVENKKSLDEGLFPSIVKQVFNGKTIFLKYSKTMKKNPREKFLVKFAGFLQQTYSKFNLFFRGNSSKKIMVFGGKLYFDSTIRLLLKNKKVKVFNFDDRLKKTFFVGPRLLPFYVFSGKKKKINMEFFVELNKIISFIDNTNFFNLYGIDKELNNTFIFKLKDVLNNQALIISRKINEMLEIFKKQKTKILLLSEDHSIFAKASIRVAKLLKIPTIVFLHGLPVRDMNFGPFEPDFFLVYGEGIKEKYLEHTPKSETKIKAIGCPRYDSFNKSNNESNKNIILYPLDCAGESIMIPDRNITKKKQKESLRILFRVLKKFPEYKLLIKLKPNWDMAKLPLLIAKQENFNNFEIIEKGDNLKLMNNAKILIINHTTMGIESLLLGKPVISISFKELDEYSPYSKINAIEKVYNEKELEKAIKNIKNHKSKPSFEHFLISDKNASKRAVKLINAIIST
jgi:predicted glycosyltransferase